MKRFLSLLICILMLISSVPVSAEAPDHAEPEEILEEDMPYFALPEENPQDEDMQAEEPTEPDPHDMIFGSPDDLVPLVGGAPSIMPMDAYVPTEAQVAAAIYAMSSRYPEGASYGSDIYQAWNGGVYSGGYGGAGFAFLLSDAAFGSLPARQVDAVFIDEIHVGDILRLYSNTHSVIVLEVYSDHVIVAEGNFGGRVHWGRSIPLADIDTATFLLTRYPEGTFSGSFAVSYDANGGTNPPSPQFKSPGQPLALTWQKPTRLFYRFSGWAVSPGGQVLYQPGSFYSLDESATLYAVWTPVPRTTISSALPQTLTAAPSGDEPALFRFTPALSGTYVFASSGSLDASVYLYLADGTPVAFDDNSGSGSNFRLSRSLTAGTEYCIAVCLVNPAASGTVSMTVSATSTNQLATPVISGVGCVDGGVNITWNAVSGAAKYRVFRRNGTSWATLGDTTATSFRAVGLTSGMSYTFTVRCVSADGKSFTSAYDTAGKTITYLAMPSITSVANAADGVSITWNAIPGAVKYRVFRRSGSSWIGLGDTAGTSFRATGLTSGTAYTFTVRCVSADGKSFTSAYDTAGKTITYLTAPSITSVTNAADGVNISWNAVPGAAKYRVFRRSGSSWASLGDTTGTSFRATGLTGGTAYTFTVRCVSADGKSYTSAYDTTGKTITYNAMPVISSLTNGTDGVNITWNAVPGAVKYRVFRRSGSSWIGLGDTADTSFRVTGLTGGTAYTFTVRCVSADGKSFTSAYDTAGKTITYITAPVLTSVTNTADGVNVRWNASAGAEKYRVYYKTAGTSWVYGNDSTGTSCTVTGLTPGTAYTFTVRCITPDAKATVSAYDPTGKTITFSPVTLAAPVLTDVKPAANGITVRWQAVSGASQYNVFWRTSDGSWVSAGKTSSTSFTVTGLTSGTRYTFTVRCISSDGKRYTSPYDTVGLSLVYGTATLPSPVLQSAECTGSGVLLRWEPVSGAERYRVFWKTTGGWVERKDLDTTGTSAVMTNLLPGTRYTFTVRCINASGTAYTSTYDSVGKTLVYNPIATPAVRSLRCNADGILLEMADGGENDYLLRCRVGQQTRTAFFSENTYCITGLTAGDSCAISVAFADPQQKTAISDYCAQQSIVFTPSTVPVLTDVILAGQGIEVNWQPVSGMSRYRVFYKVEGGSWITAGDTDAVSYIVGKLTPGVKYIFTVRCISSGGKSYLSGCDSVGKALIYQSMPHPEFTSVRGVSGGVSCQWSAVSGAQQYLVLAVDPATGAEQKILTASTACTFHNLKPGTLYTLRVCCADSASHPTSSWSASESITIA